MNLSFIPQPKYVREKKGMVAVPYAGMVYIADGIFRDAASDICTFLDGFHVISTRLKNYFVSLARKDSLPGGGYNLKIDAAGILLEAGSEAGAFSGAQTLRQIFSQCSDRRLPAIYIRDWPDYAVRGVYYDVSRGRIPKTARLQELVEKLSRYKINQFQLYIEHTFLFHGHPEIGKNVNPITSEDILLLDEACRDRYIELVPSLACLGHLSKILSMPRYRHLAEDWGIGKYVSPEEKELPAWQRRVAWSLAPANQEVYAFLESLFEEFLPLFSSDKFNVCCDETWDLGMGQSFDLCRRRGRGRLYLDHILRLREMVAKYGKKIMFWGDIIRNFPELHSKIPKDVTLLDWGYDHNHPFERVKDLKKAGVKYYVCPGTGSWNSLFPRLPESITNIHGFAVAGKKYGSTGLLNTDWGDGGHYNFMELSWPGYLFGAEQAWNVVADRKNFITRFCRVFLNAESADLPKALADLSDIAQLQIRKNRNIWQEIFFALPGDSLFAEKKYDCWMSKKGKISIGKIRLDSRLGKKTLIKLGQIRKVLVRHAAKNDEDKQGVLPYWVFTVDTMIHSARKLSVLGCGGANTVVNRRSLRREMQALLKRFRSLWMERNRESEINITIDKYRRVIKAL